PRDLPLLEVDGLPRRLDLIFDVLPRALEPVDYVVAHVGHGLLRGIAHAQDASLDDTARRAARSRREQQRDARANRQSHEERRDARILVLLDHHERFIIVEIVTRHVCSLRVYFFFAIGFFGALAARVGTSAERGTLATPASSSSDESSPVPPPS